MLFFFYKSLSLSNSTCNIAFFSFMANLLFKLITSKFKFPIFKLTIAMVWNNSTTISAYITSAATSSTNFSVLICLVGFLDPFVEDPSSCSSTPQPKFKCMSFVNSNLLISTCNSSGLNIVKGGCVSIFSIFSPLACRPPCVCCCYCCCCECCGLSWLSIQSS